MYVHSWSALAKGERLNVSMGPHIMLRNLCFGIALFVAFDADAGDPKKKTSTPTEPEGLKALQHPDAKVRYRAAQTLADLGPTAKFALPELFATLKDKNVQVRVKAAEAIWKIEAPPVSSLMPTLLAALKDADANGRAAAPPVIALFETKAKPAVPAMIELLNDKQINVRMSAIGALGELGPTAKSAAGPLLDLSADKEFFLLEPFVGAALANLGSDPILLLAEALAHKLPERRRVAAYALGAMGPGAIWATQDLVKAMSHADPATRRGAAFALGKIGPPARAALPTITSKLGDPDVYMRIDAALASWRISGNADYSSHIDGVLAGSKSTDVRDAACQALGSMKAAGKLAVFSVTELLADKELRVRAITTLGAIGPGANSAVMELRKGFKDKDAEVQLWTAYAVWQITGDTKETLPIIEEALASETLDRQAAHLLGEMGAAAQPALRSLIAIYREDDDARFRQAVGAAIKKIDPRIGMKLGIR